jgi:hypothetical protein
MTSKSLIAFGLLILMVVACEEEPESIYESGVIGNDTPVVTSVSPDSNFSADNVTFSGVGVVQIVGENFSPVSDFNNVFFNGSPGNVLSATETTLRVQVPNISGDSIEVQVAVQGAFHFGIYDNLYEMISPVAEIGGFDDLDLLYAIACDETETLWVTAFGNPTVKIIGVEPDSLKKDMFFSRTVSSTSFKYGGLDRLFMTGGVLLYAMNRATEQIDASVIVQLPSSKTTMDVDFASPSLGFIAVKEAQSSGPSLGTISSVDMSNSGNSTVADYDSLLIESIRVFGNELYVAGSYQIDGVNQPSMIWKNTITGSTLGANELVLDLADYPEYGSAQITAITFSNDGKLYMGLNSASAVLVLADGILTPFYDPVLTPPTQDLTWGNDNFLYQLKSNRLIKIDMVEAGALYPGRY